MQIGRSRRGNLFRLAARQRNGIYDGVVIFPGVTADGEHVSIERNDMVIIVPDDISGINQHWRLRFQIEAVEPPLAIIDQGFAIQRPVGGLEHIVCVVNDLPVTAGNIQDLQPTSEGILPTIKSFLHRHDDAYIVEDGLLHNLIFVRAEKQPHIDFLAQIQIADLNRGERLTVMGNRHDIGIAFSFQLDNVRADERRPYFFGSCTLCSPELECNQPITVNTGADRG